MRLNTKTNKLQLDKTEKATLEKARDIAKGLAHLAPAGDGYSGLAKHATAAREALVNLCVALETPLA